MWCLRKTGQVNDMINDREYISAVNLPSGSKKYMKDEEVREVVQGIDETDNNYIEMKSGIREYLSTTVPTGNIPTDSMGMGFDEGVYTYKPGTKVSEGEPTANEFTGDYSQFDNQGGTGSTYDYFKLTGDYTITLTCKGNCTTPTGVTIGLNADGGVVTGGYTTLVAQRGNYTQGQVITGKTSDDGYQYVYIYGGSTTLEWLVEHFDIMLNKGNTALPYEPYGKQKFLFYANGQPLADYTIYGNDGGVGDRTAQLFDVSTATHGRIIWATGAAASDDEYLMSDYIPVEVGKTYTCSTTVWFIGYDSNDTYLGTYNEGEWDKNGLKNTTTFVNSATLNAAKIRLLKKATSLSSVMLNSGSTALPYEPYGKYKIPVICGNTTTNIYVDSPLDDGDSIDYATAQVAIPTVDGENTLICDTNVQPSKVSLSYTGWHSDLDKVFESIDNKQDELTFDTIPTSGSTNPVISGGVYTALEEKQNTVSDLPTIRSNAALGAEAATTVQQLDTDIHTYIGVDLQLENYYYWDITAEVGGTAVKKSNSAWKASRVISVSEGETYKVIANQGITHKARVWALCDNNMKIVSMSEDAYKDQMLSETFTVPTGATKLIVSHFFVGTSQGTPHLGIKTLKSEKFDISGKKLSLLGDSISAFVGTLPQGNEAYYTGSNVGVADAFQMWWNILCDRTGLEPLVINAWSGSGITQLTDSGHSSKVPMSDMSRCQALHSGSTNPDIILIAGGVNDYTYAEQSSQTPSNWDGSTAPVSGNSFDETYAVMIKNIQTAYPNAIVVCLSTFFTMRGTDNGYTLVNGEGLTQADYDKAIEKVARLMRVPYISVDTCGFSRSNYYPTYAQDSSTIPTHPNEAGQKVIGEYISCVLPAIVKAFIKGE